MNDDDDDDDEDDWWDWGEQTKWSRIRRMFENEKWVLKCKVLKSSWMFFITMFIRNEQV